MFREFRRAVRVKMRAEGLWGVLIEGVGRVLSLGFCFERFVLVTRAGDTGLVTFRSDSSVVVRQAGISDMALLGEIVTPFQMRMFERFFKEQKVCVIGIAQGKAVYYGWISFEQRNFLRLAKDEAYLFGAYTVPAWRNRGLHVRGTMERVRIALSRGYTTMVALVRSGNRPAYKALKESGFVAAGRAFNIHLPLFHSNYAGVRREGDGGRVQRYRVFWRNN